MGLEEGSRVVALLSFPLGPRSNVSGDLRPFYFLVEGRRLEGGYRVVALSSSSLLFRFPFQCKR